MNVTQDAFLGGRLHLWQPAKGFRAGSDAVLLAAAVPAISGQTVLDLGCGVGAAMYCLGARVPGLTLTGVERDADTAELARRNGAAKVVVGDVLALPPDLRNQQFDHVICNPPYFPAHAGSPAADAAREAALREARPGDFARWVDVACKRTAPKGSVTFISRTDRLADILTPMAGALGSIVVLPIAAKPDEAAPRILVQGIKGGRAALRLQAPFVLHAPAGGYLPEAEAVLRHCAAIGLR